MHYKIFLFFFIVLKGHYLFAQGPLDGYLKGKGILDLAPSISILRASKFLGPDASVYNESFQGTMINLFAEYGVNKNLDLVATGAYVFTSTQNGLQDGGIFAKYRPFYKDNIGPGRLGILLGGGIGFPLANYEPLATGAIGQKAIAVPIRAIMQWESHFGLFFNLSGGYSWRLDQLKDADVTNIRALRPNYQTIKPRPYSTVLFKMGFPAKHFYTDAWLEWQKTSGGG